MLSVIGETAMERYAPSARFLLSHVLIQPRVNLKPPCHQLDVEVMCSLISAVISYFALSHSLGRNPFSVPKPAVVPIAGAGRMPATGAAQGASVTAGQARPGGLWMRGSQRMGGWEGERPAL